MRVFNAVLDSLAVARPPCTPRKIVKASKHDPGFGPQARKVSESPEEVGRRTSPDMQPTPHDGGKFTQVRRVFTTGSVADDAMPHDNGTEEQDRRLDPAASEPEVGDVQVTRGRPHHSLLITRLC